MRHLNAALGALKAADTRNCAGVTLFNDKGELFLVRRSEGQGRDGEWEGPGGHIQDDEDAAEGALREFHEEVGKPPELEVLDRISSTTPKGAKYTNVFAVTSEDWEPTLNHEHDDWGWFPLDALPSPTNPGLLKALEQFVNGKADVSMTKEAQDDYGTTGVAIEDFPTLFGVEPEMGTVVELNGRFLEVVSIVMIGEPVVRLREVGSKKRPQTLH